MIGTGLVDRLRRRDPDRRIRLRAVRLTLVALPAYYVCLYGLSNPVLATYVVFGVVAAGLFIKLPGPARIRSRVLLAALPVSWALITVATALDRKTLWAVAATFVVGFSVAFVGVGGPRLVGLASGLQLFYIVANFPPHHGNALPVRLIGATVGVVLVAVAEVVLWPGPPPVPYQRRLADAVDAVAALLEASADALAGHRCGDGELGRRRDRAAEAVELIRMADFPRTQRPVSASRRDRALRDGAATTREIAEQVRRFMARRELEHRRDDDMATSMRHDAEAMRRASRALTEGPPADTGDGLHTRMPKPGLDNAAQPRRIDFDYLRLWTSLQAISEHVDILGAAVGVAVGQPSVLDRRPGGTGAFWYARNNDAQLFWRQLRVHLTPRSVYFQGAVRLAVALAAARLVAAELSLSHGFWVLLGTLTVMRTSAANTRTSLVSAATGTLIGAVVTGLLLSVAPGTVPYAIEFLVAALLSFAAGPLLGLLWSQAALTVMITLVFAQLSPTDWSLAQVRLLDVIIGGAVGVIAGLLMWPKGAGGELRRRIGSYLRADAELIDETVAMLAGRERYPQQEPKALHAARHEYILADASLCLYYLERPDARMTQVHWDACMVAGHHIVHGAELILRHDLAGSLASWPEAAATLSDVARQLKSGYLDIAGQLPDGHISRPVATPVNGEAIGDRAADIIEAGGGRPEDPLLVEIADWLIDLSENLDWIQTSSGRPPAGR
ncbi:MAG TPA: FUSC family protein [Rugosimonospora sp.]